MGTNSNGVGYRGGRFIFFDFDVELTLTLTNIVTDICLCLIAFQTVRSFRLPLRAVLFPCCLISVGILVAFGRLALIIITRNAPSYTTYATIPFELFAELETFLSVFVACIPGLRVFMRRRQEMGWRRKSAALGAGETGFGAPVGEMTVLDSREGRRSLKGAGLDLEEMPVSPRGSVVSRPWGPINSNNSSRTPTAERIRSDGAVFLSGEEFLR